MSDAEERRDSGDLLQEEVQMSTKRSLSLATRPLGDLSPHAASQLHSYLLQLVDPLLHAADGGQRAECLGVEAPEGVLPADLEQRDDPSHLARDRKCHMISRCHLSWG